MSGTQWNKPTLQNVVFKTKPEDWSNIWLWSSFILMFEISSTKWNSEYIASHFAHNI